MCFFPGGKAVIDWDGDWFSTIEALFQIRLCHLHISRNVPCIQHVSQIIMHVPKRKRSLSLGEKMHIQLANRFIHLTHTKIN